MAEKGKGQLVYKSPSPESAAENGPHQDDASDTEVLVATY